MGNRFSAEEDSLILKNGDKMTSTEIVSMLQTKGYVRGSSAIRSRLKLLKSKSSTKSDVGDTPAPEASVVDTVMDKIFGGERKQLKVSKQAAKKKSKGKKILSLSDWHIPFERRDLVEQAVEEHKDADILVINGDFLDMYAASTFPKHKSIALIKEYNIALGYLKDFSKIFPEVHLIRGNHEERYSKIFHQSLTREVSSMVCPDILSRLANGEEYNHDGTVKALNSFDNIHYDNKNKFWKLIGNTLFVHPSAFSAGPGATVLKTMRYFEGRFPFDAVIIGHTHMGAQFVYNGKLLIEQGCLARPLEYQVSPKLMYSMQASAYAVIYQDEAGNTDLRNSKVIYCE